MARNTQSNNTFDFAAPLPTIQPIDNSAQFSDLVLSFHLNDTEDWYYLETPTALKAFGGAEAATVLAEMISVQQLKVVNERFEPDDGVFLPFKLFAAIDTDAGDGLSLIPQEEFAGVPDYYLIQVENPGADSPKQYRFEFSDTLGVINDVATRNADRLFESQNVGAKAIAIALGDINNDGFDEVATSVIDAIGSPFDLLRAPEGTSAASVIDATTVEIQIPNTDQVVSLALPAPILQDSIWGDPQHHRYAW